MSDTAQLPGSYIFTFYQGCTFSRTLNVTANGTALDMAYYSGAMKVRDASGDLIVELSTNNGRLTLGSDGSVVMLVSAAVTAVLPFGTYNYDLILTDETTGVVTPLLAGSAVVTYSPTGSAI